MQCASTATFTFGLKKSNQTQNVIFNTCGAKVGQYLFNPSWEIMDMYTSTVTVIEFRFLWSDDLDF